jgi:protein-tyrosine phosphatase
VSELFQVDDHGHLFISPAIHDWTPVLSRGIDAVIDLEGGVDAGVPTSHNRTLYVYFPIFDDDLPDPVRLASVVSLGSNLVRSGHRVLSHCGMGFNRSALVAGLILNDLGMPGTTVVSRLRERRPGALFNERFAEYLLGLPGR